MLTQKVSLVLTGLATLALAAGCTIKSVDTSNTSDSTSNGVTSSNSSSGVGGSGSTTVGAGGAGGGDATSSSSVGVGGSGGGAPTCYSETSLLNATNSGSCTGVDVPLEAGASTCGDGFNEPPPGKGYCAMGFDLFTKGAAQVLQSCLADIPVQKPEVCDAGLIDDCYFEATQAACANDGAEALCGAISTGCAAGGDDTFTAELLKTCNFQLKPFNTASVDGIEECFNTQDPTLSCADAYDACILEAAN